MAKMKQEFQALIIEHNLIEFHDFVFPSWEEFCDKLSGHWRYQYQGFVLIIHVGSAFLIASWEGDDYKEERAQRNRQGYMKLQTFLNEQKRAHADEACR